MILAAPTHCAGGTHGLKAVMADPTSFGRLFELHCALEEAVSTAAKDGVAIRPAEIAAQLLVAHPQPGISGSDIHQALVEAAARAGVSVRSN